jgi:hypothetical protein
LEKYTVLYLLKLKRWIIIGINIADNAIRNNGFANFILISISLIYYIAAPPFGHHWRLLFLLLSRYGFAVILASLPLPSGTVGGCASVSSSLGIAKVNFVSALAHSSTLIEGEFKFFTSSRLHALTSSRLHVRYHSTHNAIPFR